MKFSSIKQERFVSDVRRCVSIIKMLYMCTTNGTHYYTDVAKVFLYLERKNIMYEKVSTDLNFVDREKNVGKFWRNQKIFEKSMKAREGNPTYTCHHHTQAPDVLFQ